MEYKAWMSISFHKGSMIRCFRRLEELMRQMCQAAKSIGNTELENKFAEGTFLQFCIERNLPFVILPSFIRW